MELTKPRVVALIVFTAIVGTLLASPGMPPLGALVWGNLGVALAAGCAAAINHVLDREDRRADVAYPLGRCRTGTLGTAQALGFACVAGRDFHGHPLVAGEPADRRC
jgi:protoheme IX farnesyltransferase